MFKKTKILIRDASPNEMKETTTKSKESIFLANCFTLALPTQCSYNEKLQFMLQDKRIAAALLTSWRLFAHTEAR